jgi:hypothetical protein
LITIHREIRMSRTFLLTIGILSLMLTSCRSPAPAARGPESERAGSRGTATQEQTTAPEEEPDTVPPADVAHGEARIGGPEADPAPVSAQLAPAKQTRTHVIRLEMKHTPVTIA